MHFEVELPFPRVVGEAGFLGRILTGVLDGSKVFGEDNAAFEFEPAGVFAGGEVDGAAGLPEMVPVLAAVILGVSEIYWKKSYINVRIKFRAIKR